MPDLEAVTNVTIHLINNNGLLINWTTSEPCIDHYTVTINSNNTHNESRTTNNTNITVDTLIIGTNYSLILLLFLLILLEEKDLLHH